MINFHKLSLIFTTNLKDVITLRRLRKKTKAQRNTVICFREHTTSKLQRWGLMMGSVEKREREIPNQAEVLPSL